MIGRRHSNKLRLTLKKRKARGPITYKPGNLNTHFALNELSNKVGKIVNLPHVTEARGHFNRQGDFIEAPIGITTTGVWNNNTAHAVKFVPPNNFKIPNVRTRRKKHIQHAVSKFNMTKYLQKPLPVIVESTNSESSRSRSRSRSRSKSASPKPALPNFDQIEKDRARRANFLAKMKKQK